MSVGAAGMPGYLACRWARGFTGLTVACEIEPPNIGSSYARGRMMPRADPAAERIVWAQECARVARATLLPQIFAVDPLAAPAGLRVAVVRVQ